MKNELTDMDERLWPLALHVMAVEGFQVFLSLPSCSVTRRHGELIKKSDFNEPVIIPSEVAPGAYGFVKAASKKTPFWKWRAERFNKRFPNITVSVLKAEGGELEPDDFLAEALPPTISATGGRIKMTLSDDRSRLQLRKLGDRLRDRWTSKVVSINTDDNGIFGFWPTHELTIEVQAMRLPRGYAALFVEAFRSFARRHGLRFEEPELSKPHQAPMLGLSAGDCFCASEAVELAKMADF